MSKLEEAAVSVQPLRPNRHEWDCCMGMHETCRVAKYGHMLYCVRLCPLPEV